MLSQLTNEVCELIANQWIADADIAASKVHLFKSSFVPGQTNVLADFNANEVNFTGYAAVASGGAFSVGLNDAGNVEAQLAVMVSFVQTGIGAIDVAGGWYLTNAGGTAILASGVLDTPFEFNKIGNTLNVQPKLQFPNTSDDTASTLVGP
jgi:hypothetical protein